MSEAGSNRRPLLAEPDDAGGDDLASQSIRTDFDCDNEIWYQDGTIILIAQGTGFRVYRGMLAERAEIFRDILSIPQPPDTQLAFGCPVVHLSDTAIALREFLNALFREERYSPTSDVDLAKLSYRIRLSHKYGAEKLLKRSIQELQKLYPTDYSSVQHRQFYSSGIPRGIVAANLADLTNTSSVLPSALYSCCQLPDEMLFEGTVLPDGTVERLSRDNLLRCSRAKAKLAFRHAQSIHEIFSHEDSQDCLDNSLCRDDTRIARDAVLDGRGVEGGETDALAPLGAFFSEYRYAFSDGAYRCGHCMSALYAREVAAHNAVWKHLPSYMGVKVEGWGDKAEDSDLDV
ncbi:uncharacterized protein C8Q71DRAFT_709962 [Rhodofomes roseus]|uniref:BTB domain-containing protein n=1 Tax=Rhodofomes roseus TaxID=34475 RepID=A0ABQ8KDU6_9APHY|nr:uncharacterized protein C8Q71DRAFT_709962 [Rhodofomes roseus]KAH9835442.1 hypothetical protein C8Q71DRAFT_709962 [Rhodofomes roseus]